jgi:hypothetical protein
MNLDELADTWRTQSAVTEVGQSGTAIDELPSGLSELRKVSQ